MSNSNFRPAGPRKMRLATSIYAGETSQAWRLPGADAGARSDFNTFLEFARIAEAARFDALFLPDTGAPARLPDEVMRSLSSLDVFEPLVLMSALATHTTHIGLVYTASATFNEPYNIARQVASLDHLSKGRAGWNLVTSFSRTQAANFGGKPQPGHGERYERAKEFYDVVEGLWDTFEDDAFIRDKASGTYVDTSKLHYLEHKGEHFSVEGPLRAARSPQGRPVVAQAGASEVGRDLGARTADMIFCTNLTLEDGKSFTTDIKCRAVANGRHADDIKILTGTAVVWGETDEEAQRKFDEVSSFYSLGVAIHNLGIDLGGYDPDQPFPPDLPPNLGSQGHQKAITDYAIRNKLTLRQTALGLAATGKHRALVGSTQTIADNLQQWFEEGGCDGFVILLPTFAQGLREFTQHVVPELQRRGLFRTEYEGITLRENLGVPRPANKFVTSPNQILKAAA